MRPTADKLEVMPTYACSLDCDGCNRGSFLKEPHTPDMSVDDLRSALAQCDELQWAPRILFLGGEPTMHPDFEEMVRVATEWSAGRRRDWAVQVWSNAYTPKTRAILQKVKDRYCASINPDTHKEGGAIRAGFPGWDTSIFVSPTDLGMPLRKPCWQYAWGGICGVSVDSQGFAPCAIGTGLAGLLGEGRVPRLADLFDEEKRAAVTAKLCGHCGFEIVPPERKEGLPKRFGVPVSPTWERALRDRR